MGMLQLSQLFLGRVHSVLRNLASLPRLDQHRPLPIRVGPGLLERPLCPRGASPRLGVFGPLAAQDAFEAVLGSVLHVGVLGA